MINIIPVKTDTTEKQSKHMQFITTNYIFVISVVTDMAKVAYLFNHTHWQLHSQEDKWASVSSVHPKHGSNVSLISKHTRNIPVTLLSEYSS